MSSYKDDIKSNATKLALAAILIKCSNPFLRRIKIQRVIDDKSSRHKLILSIFVITLSATHRVLRHNFAIKYDNKAFFTSRMHMAHIFGHTRSFDTQLTTLISELQLSPPFIHFNMFLPISIFWLFNKFNFFDGAVCISQFYKLEPIVKASEKVMIRRVKGSLRRWVRVSWY